MTKSPARIVVLLSLAVGCRTRPLDPFGITAIDAGRSDGDGGGSIAESDHALLCDGVDDEVSVDLTAQWMPEFTIEMWFRGDDIPTTATGVGEFILYAPSSKPLEPSLSVAFESPETIDFSYLNQCSTATGDDGEIAGTSARQWHHIATTVGPDNVLGNYQMSIWIDGGVRNIGAAMPTCISTIRVLLCRAPPSEFPAAVPFTGAIDELRISDIQRYHGPFHPASATFTADEHTLLLMHFDSLPLTDDGPRHVAVSTSGDPQLTTDVPP